MQPTPRRHPARWRPAARHRGRAVLLVAVLLGAGPVACTTPPDPGRTASPSAGTSAGTSASTASPSPAPDPTPDPTPDPAPDGSVPAPDEHSAVGELAPGFPAALLPVPDDADILVSTYAPVAEPGAGQPYDVSLNVRTALPVDDVVALYRTSLTAAGFVETVGAPAGGLAAESTYSRSAGAELVTVAVLDRDATRTVTVGGRVHAGG